MEAKTKKRLLIVGLLLAIGGGVGIALHLGKKKKKAAAIKAEEERMRLEEESKPVRSGNSSSGGSGGFSSPDRPTDSNSITEFQNYANSQGESLSVDGVWGNNTQKAWDSYGEDFKNQGKIAETTAQNQSSSFKTVAKDLGIRAKNKGSYYTLLTNSKAYGLSGGAGQAYIVVNNEGVWRMFFIANGTKFNDKKLVAKGRYYNGGKRLTVGFGKNKGVIFDGKNFGTTCQSSKDTH